MRVAVITVGDELLAGDTVNTNAAWLGTQLAARGADVERVVVVPDRIADIARAVEDARAAYDAVIVTGGLGPTHDDVTMEGIAAAVDRQVEEHADAVDWFDEHPDYAYADLVEGTAHLPQGSRLLPNDEGVAPGAVIEADGDEGPIYVLPGVPAEMKAMFERIADEFTGATRDRVFIETGEPESALVKRLVAVQERFGVSVGSYPGDGRVRIKVEGTDATAVEEAANWLRERVDVDG